MSVRAVAVLALVLASASAAAPRPGARVPYDLATVEKAGDARGAAGQRSASVARAPVDPRLPSSERAVGAVRGVATQEEAPGGLVAERGEGRAGATEPHVARVTAEDSAAGAGADARLAPPPDAAGAEVLAETSDAGAAAPAGGPGAGDDAVEHFDSARSDAAGDASAPDGGEPFDSARSDVAGDAGVPDGGLADAAADGGVPDAGGWAVDLTPVAAPAYTPELGFLFAAGGVLSWNGDPARPDIPRSSATLIAGAGTVGAFLAQARVASFWRADTVRATLTLDVRDMPDHYFGVGFENGLTRPQGDATTLYRRTWWQVTPAFLFRVRGPVFVGTTFDFTGTLTRDESAGVRGDPDFQRGGPRVVNSGWGATLSIDTRDVPVNAWRGVYLAATWLGYAPWAGATTQWQSFNVDYRQYVTLGRPGSTLAWQVKYRTAWGEVPWSDLSQLGTPWDLRAYRWGRYRDRTALSALVEYRFMLPFAATSFFSRFGLAGWLGVGALGAGPVPDVQHLLPSAGVGARFDVQKRITLRLDFGFGRESRAVYFNFLEAF